MAELCHDDKVPIAGGDADLRAGSSGSGIRASCSSPFRFPIRTFHSSLGDIDSI
jgi:hypothetical protein